MKNLFKGKLGTVLILLATLVLAGVAVFTAIRLYDLRNQSVAPNAPSSIPHAAELAQEGQACGGNIRNAATCAAGLTCVAITNGGAAGDFGGTCQKTDQNTCSLSFTLNTATTTPTPTATTHATVTPTPTATAVPQCNTVCTSDTQCISGLTCHIPTGATTGNCRNATCTSETSCVCATTTPTPTTVPTGTPNSCNGTCGSNFNCQNGLMCYQGFCRNPSCASNSSCGCGGTATATPTAPTLPQSGTDWPTVAGFGLGIFVIVGSLLLAL